MIFAILVAIAGWYRKPAAAVSLSCIGLVFNFAQMGWPLVVVLPASQVGLMVGVFIASVVPAYFVGAGLRWAWVRYRSGSSSETASLAMQEGDAAASVRSVSAQGVAGTEVKFSRATEGSSSTLALIPDARNNYQAALVRYDRARQEARRNIEMIRRVSSALNDNLGHFLELQYGIHIGQILVLDPEAAFDMAQWPDADKLKTVLTEWADSFRHTHECWDRMSTSERVGFTDPPSQVS